MKRMTIGFLVIGLLVLIGCGGGGGGTLAVAYNSVYGVNALSTEENISLNVGAETIETVLPYDQNASIIEKAVGSDITACYTVTGGTTSGQTLLQSGKTYFYAATDCTDAGTVTQDALAHTVETDTQINIVNTSSDILLAADVNISVNGVQVNVVDTVACDITAIDTLSEQDQNISVIFTGGETISRVLPSDANRSVDIVIYSMPLQKAAIIPLPRLTPDAL